MFKFPHGAMFYAPRVSSILFALFLSMFAFDVFAEASGFIETLTAFVLHLLPSFFVVGLLAFAWRWDLVGVFGFGVLAVAYVVVMFGRFPWVVYVTISGPLLLISVLFLLSWRQRR